MSLQTGTVNQQSHHHGSINQSINQDSSNSPVTGRNKPFVNSLYPMLWTQDGSFPLILAATLGWPSSFDVPNPAPYSSITSTPLASWLEGGSKLTRSLHSSPRKMADVGMCRVLPGSIVLWQSRVLEYYC